MIANTATPYPTVVPHPFSLDDLRVHSSIAEASPSTSPLSLSVPVLAVVLAIGAFIWLDPLGLFAPTEASRPAPAFVPPAEPARPIEKQEIVAPLTPVPATKLADVPIAPAPVVQAPHVPAPVVRPRAAGPKPESRGNSMDKTNTTAPQASPKEKTAPPALVTKPEEVTAPPALRTTPEEKTAPPALVTKPEETTAPPALVTKPEETMVAPIVPKLGDETKNAPKPAATNDQTSVAE